MHGYVPSIAAIFRRRLAAWPEKDPLRLFVAVKDVVFETAARVLLGFELSVRPRVQPEWAGLLHRGTGGCREWPASWDAKASRCGGCKNAMHTPLLQ